MQTHTPFKPAVLALVVGAVLLQGCSNNQRAQQQHQDKGAQQQTLETQTTDAVAQPKAEEVQVAQLMSRQNLAVTADMQPAYGMKRVRSLQGKVAYPRPPMPGIPGIRPEGKPMDGENYQHYDEQRVFSALQNPVSTFSVDVDTGSYTNVRRMLNQGYLPPSDAVRVEEFINYFDYQYGQQASEQPFAVNTELLQSPFDANKHLLRVGLQGRVDNSAIAGRNLVFLLDVSGSMNQQDKLPLLKRAFKLLLAQLDSNDKVAIVVYAGASGVVLEPTSCDQQVKIEQALSKLNAGGSTNGAAGIELAYQLAQQSFIKNGVNRVILATDGDFNVGTVDHQQLLDVIATQRQKGIALTTLGFGQGNYNDHLMEQLANKGNGNYAYIDNINEARKVLVDELSASMQIIAKDVKVQVEFNPQQVAEYRLIGYENRTLNQEDFNNDKMDAGEIGAGHRVTALYELSLVGSDEQLNDALRYQQLKPKGEKSDELAFVKLRYKAPNADKSQKITQPVLASSVVNSQQASDDSRFASAVAGFAQLLKQGKYTQGMNYDALIALANASKGADPYGYRGELVQLMRTAEALSANNGSSG